MQIKMISIFFCCLCLLTAAKAQTYTVQGKLGGLSVGCKVLLITYVDGKAATSDTALAENGVFAFKGQIDNPVKALLSILAPKAAGSPFYVRRSFFLSPGVTTVTGPDIASAVISGGPEERAFAALNQQMKPLNDSLAYYHYLSSGTDNKDSLRLIQTKYETIESALHKVEEDFVQANPDSYVSLDLVMENAIVVEDPVAFEGLFNSLSDRLKNLPEGKKMASKLAIARKYAIGQPAADFSQADVNGAPVSLASFKGKYILLDFWASWCGPCRMEYPYLKKAYAQFKDKGFEIVGISLDDKKTAWTDAIKSNGFSWTELCDLNGRQNEVAQAYGITAIPQSFLISPQGIIIARNLRGNDLIEKLDEVIKPQSGAFTLKAKVKGVPESTKAWLRYEVEGKLFMDSARMDHGVFIFQGELPYPVNAMFWLNDYGLGYMHARHPDLLYLYLEKGDMTLTADGTVRNAVITGSPLNTDYARYNQFIKVEYDTLIGVNADMARATAEQRKDTSFMRVNHANLLKTIDSFKERLKLYVQQNPDSYSCLIALNILAGGKPDTAVIGPLYNGLSADVRNTKAGQDLGQLIKDIEATAIGAIAPGFTQNDVNDKPVSLSDFRGKYVLLDFWASWCAPCRAENPNVIKAYNQYKDKNFTVLSVSLDKADAKAAWLAAIKADGLEWTQVSDLKYWNNDVAKQYGIRSIPQNFLIDPNGKIIATNLKGDELGKKLKEVLN